MVVQWVDYQPDNPHKVTPAQHVKFDGQLAMQADFKHKLSTADTFTHTARCPGLNAYRNMGYIIRAREDVHVDKYRWDGFTYTDHFKNWKNSHILKVPCQYIVYVPEGYSMLVNPIAHSDEEAWYAVPGIFEHHWGPTSVSVFITTTNSKLHLPAGTPLAQTFLVPDKEPEAEFRNFDAEDSINMQKKEELLAFDKPVLERMSRTKKGTLMNYPWYHWD